MQLNMYSHLSLARILKNLEIVDDMEAVEPPKRFYECEYREG